MGLDWNPANKPKPGFEAEFDTVFFRMERGPFAKEPSGTDRLLIFLKLKEASREPTYKDLLQRYQEISIPAFETLKAPRIGHDEAANQWAEENVSPPPGKTREESLEALKGVYVLSLVEDCDGLPKYTNGHTGGYVEAYAFRAQFLCDCEEIIGLDLADEIYRSRNSADMVAFGKQLQQAAEKYAREEGRDLDNLDSEHVDFDLDVVLSAARWCIFWGERGHYLEAYA
jgi:hypothetical protein